MLSTKLLVAEIVNSLGQGIGPAISAPYPISLLFESHDHRCTGGRANGVQA
jgi:hypothetical protein